MTPLVSVIVPVYNGAAYVARAVQSALDQTEAALEVLVADNGSTDGTWDVLQDLASRDGRVRPLRALSGRGADVARNTCLDAACGAWVAVLDADDRMHPGRLERLLDFAAERRAAIVADNLRLVDPAGSVLGLAWRPARLPASLDAAGFAAANHFGRRGWTLGYVKPLVRRDRIEAYRLRYPPTRVVEDYMFLFGLLLRGETLHLCPEAYYDYVQVPGSLSRTFSRADLEAVIAVNDAHLAAAGDDGRLVAVLHERRRSIDTTLAHGAFVAALKAGRPAQALAVAMNRPAVAPLILRFGWESLAKRLARLRPRPAPAVPPSSVVETVAYFGQDCTDNAVIRRIAAFQAAGLEVAGFTFRRKKFNRNYVPSWDNLALGETRDRAYGGRLLKLAGACRKLVAARRRLAESSFFYARNLDMALLACFARRVSGSRAPLVYEVLDVQRAMLGRGLRGMALRWAERWVLAQARLLAVSSPAFVRHYFQPRQGFRGEWHLVENKILGPQLRQMAAPAEDPPGLADLRRGGRWVIGWFGTLRCVKSLEILAALAEALPDRIAVYLRGFPTETGLAPFQAVIDRHPNMLYGGEFFSPRDLPALYGAVDLGWCFDFLDAGTNSRWLLPNRYYDCGYFNVPMLAAAGTETGRRIERLGLGWTFAPPYRDSLTAFLGGLTGDKMTDCRAVMAAVPRRHFLEEDDTGRLVRAVFGNRGALPPRGGEGGE